MSDGSKGEYGAWLKVFADVADALPRRPPITCPSCGEGVVDFQYVGYQETRLGYLQIWCPICLRGISFSRLKVPLSVDMLLIDGPIEIIQQRIPLIDEVTPI